jgi:thymidylate synthase ThyX
MPSLALATDAPRISLRSAPAAPYDGAIAAARTCYSPRVVETSEITDKQRDSIGPLTFEGGHHTVFQHAHFEFGLENISRQFVWSVLHAYPFYNSEQSSQRYVKLKEPRAFVPPIAGEALRVYEQSVVTAWDYYAELSALLKDDAWAILKELRYLRPSNSPERHKAVEREAEKKAIETARYVIPIAAFTSMVHTVSGLVLHRLHRMLSAGDTPHEARLVIGAMVDLVKDVDPLFFEKVGLDTLASDALPEASFPRARAGGDAFAAAFDARLGGRVSRLRDWSSDAEGVVSDAVRATFGLDAADLSDDEAIDRVMNPARNLYRVDMLNVSHHSPMMRALHHVAYVFEKKLSHTADSQDQRHRMVPASRPLMTFADTAAPDVVTPRLLRQNPRALAVYERAIAEAWAAKNRLLELGVPLEYALYLLPNAKALRLVESGSLLSLQHKWTLRTCFNAQEEIYLASMDEIAQVQDVHPRLGRFLGPPCVLRNKIVSPRCTEGSHFCGVPVWNSFPQAVRRL